MITFGDENDLSPLEQIRQCEAEMTRRVAAARESAEETMEKARLEAANLIKEAREAGRRAGQARYAEIISIAKEEAEQLLAQSKDRAVQLRRKGNARMEANVHQSIDFILGVEGAIERQ